MSTESHWLNVHDVAELLQIKDETVRRWIRRNELAVLELGGPRAGYRIRREDLDHFIWQRYRMRNQDSEDLAFRQEFNQSGERTQASRSVRVASDEQSTPATAPASQSTESSNDESNPYQSLVSRIPGITYVASYDENDGTSLTRSIAFVSANFEQLTGLTAHDFRTNSQIWWDHVPNEDRERVQEAQRQSFQSGTRLSVEYRIVWDDTTYWVRDEAVLGDDSGSGQPSWQGIILNITDRKQIEEALKTRSDQQAAIASLGDRALGDLDLNQLMDEAVTFVRNSLNVDLTKVLQLQPGGQSLLMRAGVGWEPGAVNNATVSAGAESQAGYTLLSNEPIIVKDLLKETRFNGPPLLRNYNVRSGLSVIIAGTGMPWGVLGAHTTSLRTFTSDDVNFLQSVANILATAIREEQKGQHDGRWLSIRSVAETLRVKDETVRRWIRRGEIPVIDLGSSRAGYRIHPSDLDQFIGERYMGQLTTGKEDTGT